MKADSEKDVLHGISTTRMPIYVHDELLGHARQLTKAYQRICDMELPSGELGALVQVYMMQLCALTDITLTKADILKEIELAVTSSFGAISDNRAEFDALCSDLVLKLRAFEFPEGSV